MRLLLNTWRPSTGSCFCVASAPPGGQSCYCTKCVECAALWTHVLLHDQNTNLNSSFNLFLNHSCKSSILKIKCSFHSHFIYKVIFQQRRGGREDGHRFSPITHINRPHCQSGMLCHMLLLRNLGGGSKAKSHHGPYSMYDLRSFQHQPQQDSRGLLRGPTGPLVLVSARLQKIQTKQKHKRQAKTEGKEDKKRRR